MEKNYSKCIEFVLAREGGYVNDPLDPGGATNLGITLATLQSWRGGNVTSADVQRLTRAEAERIYRARYWAAAWCPDLPSGIDLLVFDAAVNMGIEPSLNFVRSQLGMSIKMRNQHKVFLRTEKHLLPVERQKMFDRLSGACMPGLIVGICERRRSYYRSLSTFKTFGNGWLRRVDQVQQLAMHLWVYQAIAQGR